MHCGRWLALVALAAGPVLAQQATNAFDDPFLRATSAIANCPTPVGPLYTPAEARAQAHSRVEAGTSCYQSGRCRLPNASLYDKELAPRVVRALNADPALADSSVWVVLRQRFVTLQGCVRNAAQAREMERVVGQIDDVLGVVVQLSLPGEPPQYPLVQR